MDLKVLLGVRSLSHVQIGSRMRFYPLCALLCSFWVCAHDFFCVFLPLKNPMRLHQYKHQCKIDAKSTSLKATLDGLVAVFAWVQCSKTWERELKMHMYACALI